MNIWKSWGPLTSIWRPFGPLDTLNGCMCALDEVKSVTNQPKECTEICFNYIDIDISLQHFHINNIYMRFNINTLHSRVMSSWSLVVTGAEILLFVALEKHPLLLLLSLENCPTNHHQNKEETIWRRKSTIFIRNIESICPDIKTSHPGQNRFKEKRGENYLVEVGHWSTIFIGNYLVELGQLFSLKGFVWSHQMVASLITTTISSSRLCIIGATTFSCSSPSPSPSPISWSPAQISPDHPHPHQHHHHHHHHHGHLHSSSVPRSLLFTLANSNRATTFEPSLQRFRSDSILSIRVWW